MLIETVSEDLAVKQQIFRELDRLCPPVTMLASDSSSFVPAAYAAGTLHPERVLGMKTGMGFYQWTPEFAAEVRARIARILIALSQAT